MKVIDCSTNGLVYNIPTCCRYSLLATRCSPTTEYKHTLTIYKCLMPSSTSRTVVAQKHKRATGCEFNIDLRK